MTIFNEFTDRFLQNNSTRQGYNDMVVNIFKLRKNVTHSKLIPATIVNETETKEYLIKMAPADPDLRKRKPYDKMYRRECFVYTDCLPEYVKYEKIKGVEKDSRFKAFPICYATSLKPFEETLILENLERSQSFQLWDKKFSMNGNHIKLVLKEYAKFHAISFALKERSPALMKYIENNSNDILMECLQKSNELDSIEILCDRLKRTDEVSENPIYLEKMNFLRDNVVKIMTDCVQRNHRTKNVLLHGGNCFKDMLFSYKDPITKCMPSEVKFTDWQKARFGSLILDVASFLYTSLEASTLPRFEDFLAFYHNSFITHGEKLNFSLNNIYSYEEFRADWSRYSIFGLGLAILVLYKVLMGKDFIPKKYSEDEANCNEEHLLSPEYIEHEKHYLRRVLDVFKHFVEKKYI